MGAMPLEHEVEYPTSDGQPMAETTLHREVMADLISGLERRYADRPDVWVGGNLFLCYRQGDPTAALAPDVLLAEGVTKWKRPNYLLWEERPPRLIFEISSKKTRREDLNRKKQLYEQIGVEEYILFDPYGEYLKPKLQGFRRVRGLYRPIPPNPDGTLESRTTGLTLRPEGDRLRLVDTESGEKLLWNDELAAAYAQATERAAQAEERALEAEARLRALEDELARLRRP